MAIPPLCLAALWGTWCTRKLASAKCVSQVSYTKIIALEGVAGQEEVQGPLAAGVLRQNYSFRLLKTEELCETIFR